MSVNNLIMPKRKFIIKSINDFEKSSNEDEIIYLYKVRFEAGIDIAYAFAAIHMAKYSYYLKDNNSNDGAIIFKTKCPIDELREIWDEMNKDLHVMIESLNYVNDYTGERYYCDY